MKGSATAPIEHRAELNGIELAWFEWRPELRGREAPILMAHATGFHARVFDPVIAHLGERHVIAVDQRGHGRSQNVDIDHWGPFGEDLAALVRHLDLRGVVGVGHSMGAHAMVDAAAALPERFERLVLIDPVIASPDQYGEGGWAVERFGEEPHPTAKRKNRFASPEAMIERFRDRPPYSLFTAEALEAYCRYGLLSDAEGEGFELACPPEVEASIYLTSRTNTGVHESVRALAHPVFLIRAKLPPPDRDLMDFSSSPTWPELVGAFQKGRELHLADRSHFFPMEIPERTAAWILDGGASAPGDAG